jgi:Concanavalin A-like lectin/glucanases superfamily
VAAGRRVRARVPLTRWAALVVAAVLVVSGCGSDDDGDRPGPQQPVSSGPDLSGADLWLSFDDEAVGVEGATEFSDSTGGLSLGLTVATFGGGVDVVDGPPGRGSAIAFPAKCDDASGCPRAMVEVSHAPELDPGERDFEYGATVWLDPDQTTTGSNIVQKGRFGTEGGQWKLQVDSDAGEPSCVVRGNEPGAEPLVVRAEVSIADSSWHRVICRRDGDGISIDVDGKVIREDGATGSVTNESPLRVGAPGVGEDDDQFHGRLDDVYLLVAPPT